MTPLDRVEQLDGTRTYTTDALAEESKVARIYGGMHFRYSTK